MISYQIVEHGKPLQRAVLETPKPEGTEVLMRITRAGVCHSDLHIWDGYFDLGGGRRFYVKERGSKATGRSRCHGRSRWATSPLASWRRSERRRRA